MIYGILDGINDLMKCTFVFSLVDKLWRRFRLNNEYHIVSIHAFVAFVAFVAH